PPYLFKPVKEEPEDFYQSGIRTRRSGKECCGKRRPLTPNAVDADTRTKVSGSSNSKAVNSNVSTPNVAPKSPSSVSTSSNESGLDQEKKSPCTKRKKRKLEKEDMSSVVANSKADKRGGSSGGEHSGKAKRGRTRSNHSETGSASSNESTGGHEGDTEMHDDNSSSPCTPSPPTTIMCRNSASDSESIANVVRDSLVSTTPEVSLPPFSTSTVIDSMVPADPSNDMLPTEKSNVTASTSATDAYISNSADDLDVPVPVPESLIATTSHSVICSIEEVNSAEGRVGVSSAEGRGGAGGDRSAATSTVPVPPAIPVSSLVLTEQPQPTASPLDLVPAVAVSSAVQVTSVASKANDLYGASSVPITSQLFVDTSPTAKELKVPKQEPVDVDERAENDDDVGGYTEDHSLPIVREPEPKIDDGTECHRTKNAM
ncbi:unnamed protein product, partial [Soboliphyme baturini]|uniref:Transcription regulator xnp/atrx dead-box superfamily protein n=1 Tax=Soboliphyme baturini TaxID=241478 RepID=A0A183JB26_9BILA